jgi:sugar transferase (PEP-CTERM system associated)
MIIPFFKRDISLRQVFFVIGEGVLIYAAILTAAFIHSGSVYDSFLSGEALSKGLLILVICQTTLYYNELYNLKVTDTQLELGLRLTKALGIASIILALVYFLLPSLILGRGIFFISLLLLVLLIIPWRFAYNWVLKKKMFTEKILILGSGRISQEIIDEIAQRPDAGYQVSGVVSTNSVPPSGHSQDIPYLKMNGQLCELAQSFGVKKIVVAMDERRGKLPTDQLLRCKMKGIEIVEGETLYEELAGKIFVEKLNPSWLIFSDGFRVSRTGQFTKRLAGFVIAGLGLLLTLPLIPIIALAIKLDSKGPVFYAQDRCGKEGSIFKVRKFRTMVHNAEAMTGAIWATEDDDRITRLGRILRKYRFDEIPQMWSVLKGDMSFVGPRPERPEFVRELEKSIPFYSERHNVRPGITGWAQVSCPYGASVEDAKEKLKYDLFYIKNMSLVMDLIIMFKTAKIILLKTGAR